jgi:hypothetical protein
MIWRGGVATSVVGEAAPGRGKREADVNLTRPRNEKKSRGRFSCYKWTVKI